MGNGAGGPWLPACSVSLPDVSESIKGAALRDAAGSIRTWWSAIRFPAASSCKIPRMALLFRCAFRISSITVSRLPAAVR